MWSLCALCVLLSLVSGLNTGGGDHTEMYVRPGSDVLLPLSYKLAIDNKMRQCDGFEWKFERSKVSTKISRRKGCEITDYNNATHFSNNHTLVLPFSNYKSSADGTLTLNNVTWKNSGNYNVIVHNRVGSLVFNHTYTLHVQAPVSKSFLNVSCHRDGGADIICGTNSGEDLSFSIMVNKGLLLENATSFKMVENVSEVHTAAASPGPWDITCSVRNRVSDSETRRTNMICPVPLSDPVLEASCLNNGSLNISCSVENGTDPIFSLNVNGTLFSANVKKGVKSVNHVTVPSPEPWDVHCYVNSSLGRKNATTNITCQAPVSQPLLNITCLSNGSAMITCSVLSGTNPKFQLTVNGSILTPYNTSSSCCGYNYIMSPGGTWNISCSVGNELGESTTSNSSHSSCGPKTKCSTCLRNSIIGGVVALIVTTSPLLIATIYIERNTRQKKP